jgi:phage terminase large subunit-like protein
MTPSITLRRALADPKLLGGALSGESWAAWRVLLIAAMGEALNNNEREIFRKLTGRAREPGRRVEELAAVIGRRGGKSRAMATLATYIAGLCKHPLTRGERGVLLCIAPDQRQAAITLDYATAAFESSIILAQLIANRTADTLELTNGTCIEVRAASFRRLRGPTYLAVIADEAAFWQSDEFSSNADTEILNAVRPGLATTGGPLIIASSPYAKRGVLWETHRTHYGADGDPMILVAQGATREFNPSLP